MAHIRPIHYECGMQGCKARATKEVFNTRNASCGKFCAKCAKIYLQTLEKMEKISANIAIAKREQINQIMDECGIKRG